MGGHMIIYQFNAKRTIGEKPGNSNSRERNAVE